MSKNELGNVHQDVVRELNEKAEEIIKDGKKQAESILSTARREVEQKKQLIMRKMREEGRVQVKRIESLAEIEINREIHIHRAKILENIIENVFKKLKDFTTTPEYANKLKRFIEESVKHLTYILSQQISNRTHSIELEFTDFNISKILKTRTDVKLFIFLRNKDKKIIPKSFLDTLGAKFHIKLEVSADDLRTIGGVLIKTFDDKLVFDKRFEKIIELKKEMLLNQISERLWGD